MLHELFDPLGAFLLLVSQHLRRLAQVRSSHDKVGVVLEEAMEIRLHHLEVLL